ncbi:hypothetical protein GCM10028801_20300 [Nocardioides maradonensis]
MITAMTTVLALLALLIGLALTVLWARADAFLPRPPRREWFD